MTQEEWKDYKLMENGSRPEELTEELSAKLAQEELEKQMMEEEGEQRASLTGDQLDAFREQEKADEELMQRMIAEREEELKTSEEII